MTLSIKFRWHYIYVWTHRGEFHLFCSYLGNTVSYLGDTVTYLFAYSGDKLSLIWERYVLYTYRYNLSRHLWRRIPPTYNSTFESHIQPPSTTPSRNFFPPHYAAGAVKAIRERRSLSWNIAPAAAAAAAAAHNPQTGGREVGIFFFPSRSPLEESPLTPFTHTRAPISEKWRGGGAD